jgi:hypothetical protein
MTIKRKILSFTDFKKGKDSLEKPAKHAIKESNVSEEGKPGDSWIVFNKTDGFYASPETFTREEAEKFVEDFPKRFEKQGYYLTGNRERIKPEEVVLDIQPADEADSEDLDDTEEPEPFESETMHIKPVSRDEMIVKLNKRFPNIWTKKSEDFSKEYPNTGIWTGAEHSTFIDAAKKIEAFDTSGDGGKNYVDEVHKTLNNFLTMNGWYAESYDAGTFFLWPVDGGIVKEKLTDDAQDFISKKIKLLVKEGRPMKQAQAMAYSYAKKEGYDVPENESLNTIVRFENFQITNEKIMTAEDLTVGSLYKVFDTEKNGALVYSAAKFIGTDAKGNKFALMNRPNEDEVYITDAEMKHYMLTPSSFVKKK